ncbi:testis development-related protein [Aplochiton taeniatus]
MFKKSKCKVLVDYASEEDDISWHQRQTFKDKEPEGEEEEEVAAGPVSKEAKVKKIKAKKERKENKLFSSKDDEHFLLTGVKLADRRGSHKKIKDGEKDKKDKSLTEKSHCFWDSVTMTMRQITPTRKLDKMEGWEPPRVAENDTRPPCEDTEAHSGTRGSPVSFPEALELPLGLPSWAGLGLEGDSSHYANLSDSKDSTTVRWTARAKGRLAGIRRLSRGSVAESSWEGFK